MQFRVVAAGSAAPRTGEGGPRRGTARWPRCNPKAAPAHHAACRSPAACTGTRRSPILSRQGAKSTGAAPSARHLRRPTPTPPSRPTAWARRRVSGSPPGRRRHHHPPSPLPCVRDVAAGRGGRGPVCHSCERWCRSARSGSPRSGGWITWLTLAHPGSPWLTSPCWITWITLDHPGSPWFTLVHLAISHGGG